MDTKKEEISRIALKINEIAITIFKDNNSEFARTIGTNEANVRNYRSGTEPKAIFCKRLRSVLGISFEWLFFDEGEMLLNKKSSIAEAKEDVTLVDAGEVLTNLGTALDAIQKAISELANEDNILSREKLKRALERGTFGENKDLIFLSQQKGKSRAGGS